jgi:hypothetical protein
MEERKKTGGLSGNEQGASQGFGRGCKGSAKCIKCNDPRRKGIAERNLIFKVGVAPARSSAGGTFGGHPR